jgi:hypothetical protein
MGIDRVSEWSETKSAVAKPTNPKGPPNLWTEPRGNSIFVKWDPVPNAKLYEVITFDMDASGTTFQNSRGVQGTSATISDSLEPGHRQAIAVVTWVESGPGWPSVGLAVRTGYGAPSAPQINVINIDPTTVRLSWATREAAASYRVWFRNWKLNEEFRTDDYSISTSNSHDVAFLFPGTWNYEFRVVAMNGNLTGGTSNSVIPPVYPGFESKRAASSKNASEVAVPLPFLNEFHAIEGMLLDKEMSTAEDGR